MRFENWILTNLFISGVRASGSVSLADNVCVSQLCRFVSENRQWLVNIKRRTCPLAYKLCWRMSHLTETNVFEVMLIILVFIVNMLWKLFPQIHGFPWHALKSALPKHINRRQINVKESCHGCSKETHSYLYSMLLLLQRRSNVPDGLMKKTKHLQTLWEQPLLQVMFPPLQQSWKLLRHWKWIGLWPKSEPKYTIFWKGDKNKCSRDMS